MNLIKTRLLHLSGILNLLICAGLSSQTLTPTPEAYRRAYPDYIARTTPSSIVWKDETVMVFDDKRTKAFVQMLDTADLEDQLSQAYPRTFSNQSPARHQDPGRLRHEAFFRKMYGNTEAEVKPHLKEVHWLRKSLNKTLLATDINNVHKHLQAVSDELETQPELLKYVNNPAGTYKWRVIAGTRRLSTHSFGIAIDINLGYSHYWQWDCKCTDEEAVPVFRNNIPQKVVEIFEKHGFVWGGKWYHYDSMHFEYRPELL